MIPRPSLILMTAVTASVSLVANAIATANPAATTGVGKTRLGTAIDDDLNARDADAARRARALDLREQAARAAEARLKAQLEAQKAEQSPATDPNAPPPGQQYDDLAKIYQAMKPAKAAVIFEQLDLDVQMQVAQRMRERATGMILAAMSPKAAATLSMALAHKSAAKAGATKPKRP